MGIIFDGNIQSLAWDYFFTDEQGRCVAVDARGIVEALRKVYGADALVRELTGRQLSLVIADGACRDPGRGDEVRDRPLIRFGPRTVPLVPR